MKKQRSINSFFSNSTDRFVERKGYYQCGRCRKTFKGSQGLGNHRNFCKGEKKKVRYGNAKPAAFLVSDSDVREQEQEQQQKQHRQQQEQRQQDQQSQPLKKTSARTSFSLKFKISVLEKRESFLKMYSSRNANTETVRYVRESFPSFSRQALHKWISMGIGVYRSESGRKCRRRITTKTRHAKFPKLEVRVTIIVIIITIIVITITNQNTDRITRMDGDPPGDRFKGWSAGAPPPRIHYTA